MWWIWFCDWIVVPVGVLFRNSSSSCNLSGMYLCWPLRTSVIEMTGSAEGWCQWLGLTVYIWPTYGLHSFISPCLSSLPIRCPPPFSLLFQCNSDPFSQNFSHPPSPLHYPPSNSNLHLQWSNISFNILIVPNLNIHFYPYKKHKSLICVFDIGPFY